ncbi:MAG: 4Fe-4S binding protein [Desulfuromonadaceae bacterium]|nr:4Fe-4S binding protein [Desulfuromonadaceae bacterium]
MKTLRNIIEIDEEKCDGCGLCVPSCAEGAIRIVDGKARLVAEKYCDGLGACLGECPRDAIRIIEKEVEAFDEEAAMVHVRTQKKDDGGTPAAPSPPSSGCPSAQLMNFAPNQAKEDAMPRGCPSANIHSFDGEKVDKDPAAAPIPSALSHWPVQIRLVPPHAPFLKNADLLIAADCSPMAYGDFHRDFLKGKVVMMGCPKFDDMALYEERFQQIFRQAEIKSVTVLVMEVPCCQGLPALVKKTLKESGKEIPLEIVTVGLQGKILRRDAYPSGF